MPYEAYFESATECLILVDPAGRIVKANRVAEQLFGYGPDELTGRVIEGLIPERFHDVHRRHRAAYMAQPRSRPMGAGLELSAQRKDGREFPVEVSLTHVRTNDREFVICLVDDISERLAREREALRNETLRILGSIAAGMAHDLNNPLAVMSSRVELMLAEGQRLPEQIRADLEVVYNHTRRASRITQDLLALARQRPKAYQAVNLNQVVEGAILLLGGEMGSNGVRLQATLDRYSPAIMGDPVALEQVLVNLLINAREALTDGGLVQIRTETRAESAQPVRLIVSDDGDGIAAEALPQIFNFLYTNKTNGSGLGLWLSRRIVQEHGGSIEVASEPGKGATFMVSFPAME